LTAPAEAARLKLVHLRGVAISKGLNTPACQWAFSEEYDFNSQRTLETALNQVPFYRSWQALDPGPHYPLKIRYTALPALTKKDIRENFPLLPAGRDIKAALAGGEISLIDTSGTTDDKVTNIWNQSWWDTSEQASWNLNSVLSRAATGNHKEAILVNPKNVGIKSDDIDLPLEKRRLSRFLYLNEKTDPVAWSPALMDRMVEELNIFQPAVLEANPSYLARLCRYISSQKKQVFQPEAIVFTYEYPAGFHYRQIQQVFSCPLVSSYGTTETGYVFMQCEEGRLHQNSESCRVDFQPFKREYGGPLLGRILVTPFRNPWNFFLRFDTGDIGYLEESGRCPCGRRGGIILAAIAGRKVNLTLAGDGRPVTLLELDKSVSSLKGVEMYRLVQTEAAAFQLHLVSRQPDTAPLEAQAVEVLKGLYGQEARVSVVFEADMAPEVSGKYLLSRALFNIDIEKFLDLQGR
jgi:phenylacetate-CoA ligase